MNIHNFDVDTFFGLSVESGGFPSSDGEIEFTKEEQDPGAKGRERPQPPRIRDDQGNQWIYPFGSGVGDPVLQIVQQSLEPII